MSVFLTILAGETPETAEPLLATRDTRLIDVVISELLRRLERDDPRRRVLELVPSAKDRANDFSEDVDGF